MLNKFTQLKTKKGFKYSMFIVRLYKNIHRIYLMYQIPVFFAKEGSI